VNQAQNKTEKKSLKQNNNRWCVSFNFDFQFEIISGNALIHKHITTTPNDGEEYWKKPSS
jgi:hypothetical protein